ncbi:uncharacterized protein LACBIDRAFT_307204 [Laccaria bicolor S238N-H82]|uniref:Predicted protein n=1 Tax=Laccaria bicolor (strain S238N-H82 / ATCC MYA-4686) TaxID=486041 RepID=B0DPM3_LACBS|nr:uncharacterized protein LACBIDRAFT_307204 [Laccaria bicolor S238N-H82]EDR03401.1 predicted protein [Laccaria bicolor S238N-H82]|eukprot:XP_001885857.1 predicted protein [Laccaria bicolor S238N-H82]
MFVFATFFLSTRKHAKQALENTTVTSSAPSSCMSPLTPNTCTPSPSHVGKRKELNKRRGSSESTLVFVLSLYPQDVTTVAILILSWADTAAFTFDHLYGFNTCKLPTHLPILRLPLTPRKSLAGFIAASITGALIAVSFWSVVASFRNGGRDVTWALKGGVHAAGQHREHEESLKTGGDGDIAY